MASFKTLLFIFALFAIAYAVEEVREKKGIAAGYLGYGGYYGGLGRSIYPYGGYGVGYPGYGYGLGYGIDAYHSPVIHAGVGHHVVY